MKLRELYKPGDKLYIVFGIIWWFLYFMSSFVFLSDNPIPEITIAMVYFITFIPWYTVYTVFGILAFLLPNVEMCGQLIRLPVDSGLLLLGTVVILSFAFSIGSCIFVSVFLGRFYNVFSKFLKEKGWRGIAKSKELKIVAIISILTFFIAYTLSYLIDHIPLSEGLYFGVYIIIYELLMFLFGIGVGFVRKKNSLYVCFVGRLIPVIIFLFYDLIHGESYEIISCFMSAYFGVLSSFLCGYGGFLGAKLRR